MDVIKRGFDSNVFIRTTLLTMYMYVKCSCIEFACEAFDKMCERDVISQRPDCWICSMWKGCLGFESL
jgi:hypothetical protein